MLRPEALLCFLICLLGCTTKGKQPENRKTVANAYTPFYNQINEAGYLVKDGDLLVRSGTDMTSQLIRDFNRQDKTYSHSGLVFLKDGVPLVYHIVAGDENPDTKLVADSLQAFCHPRHNSGFAVYRYAMDSAERERLKSAITTWYQQGLRFDSSFNLKSDDLMYCSEMIKKGLAKATNDRIVIGTVKPTKGQAMLASSKLPLSADVITKLDVVPVDNLYLNPHCRLVGRYEFNRQ